MNKTIPKVIYMIWLGDKIPNYVNFSINAYKQANPDFTIKFIHYTIKQIEDIYYSTVLDNIYDNLLKESIKTILSKNKQYEVKVTAIQLHDIIERWIINCGKSMRFIQILSDIYRLKIIQYFGGIYLDCDTFPLKPFDDNLLKLQHFIVTRHYSCITSNNNILNDTYFFGGIKDLFKYPQTEVLQTNDQWWSKINYIIDKKKFFDLTLKYKNLIEQPFYIQHFADGNWKNKNGVIRTQLCFLDKICNDAN